MLSAMAAAPRSRIVLLSLVMLGLSVSASVVYILASKYNNATIRVRFPGGEVYFEGVTLKDGAELSVPARPTTFELRPAGKPPQVIELILQPKQAVLLDCSVE